MKLKNANNLQQIANIAEESYRVDSNFAIVPEKKESKFSYDANGNLLGIYTGTKQGDILKVNNTRTMLWDEENHLLATCDNGYLTAYWYDAAGERTVKMSGDGEGVNINGVVSAGRTGTANFTAYVNPYLVVRNGGEYTKHIYMGGQRITSKVSNSGIFSTSPVKDTLQTKYASQTAALKTRFDSLGVQYKGTEHSGSIISNAPTTASSSYFYHSDHLGSTSLITDISGEIVQHVEYVPFGGTFIDERRTANSWHTPFLFSGKERDVETGLLYVSQRYQDEKYGIWYSVDQMAEKYPNISSYVYCANNPVIFVDPDGRKIIFAKDAGILFKLKISFSIIVNYIFSKTARNDIKVLLSDTKTHTIIDDKDGFFKAVSIPNKVWSHISSEPYPPDPEDVLKMDEAQYDAIRKQKEEYDKNIPQDHRNGIGDGTRIYISLKWIRNKAKQVKFTLQSVLGHEFSHSARASQGNMGESNAKEEELAKESTNNIIKELNAYRVKKEPFQK